MHCIVLYCIVFLSVLLYYTVYNIALFIPRIYSHQQSGYAFTTVEHLLQSMSPEFLDYLQESIDAELTKKAYSKNFIDQLVMGAMRTNYGQTTDIQGFVGRLIQGLGYWGNIFTDNVAW